MTQGDDRILEALESSGLTLSPRVIAFNTDYSGNYINKRVRKLRDAGLVERVDEGLYRITGDGRAYLAGDLSAEDLESVERSESS